MEGKNNDLFSDRNPPPPPPRGLDDQAPPLLSEGVDPTLLKTILNRKRNQINHYPSGKC